MTMRVWGLALASAVVLALTVVAVGGEIAVALPGGTDPFALAPALALACVGTAWFAVGGYLALRRPRHPLGWLFAAVGFGVQAGVAGEIAGRAGWTAPWFSSPVGPIVDTGVALGIFLLLGLLPILYPTGAIEGRAAWIVAAVTTAGAVLAVAQVLHALLDPAYTWPFGPPPTGAQPLWSLWLPWIVFVAGAIGGWVLCAVRLVRARYPLRQQLAWLLVAVIAVVLTQGLGESPIAAALQAAALLLLPVAIVVGILRYRLLGIETAVPRVLTAFVLTIAIAGVYLVVAALTGAGLTGATVPSVLSAALVAVLLLPLHARVRRGVDRFVYGKRADPVRAVADLGAVVAAGEGDLSEAVLDEVATMFGARGARIRSVDGTVVAESAGARSAGAEPSAQSAELLIAGGSIGSLELLAARGGGYGATDAAMLRAVAGTVALAARAATLADELEAQRDAVVDASAVARDRLRRDLHDGLGPSLTGLRLGLQALTDALTAGDERRAERITEVLRDESERAVVEVRRIIDDLRPADLDDADLALALRRRFEASAASVPVIVTAGDLPLLPAPVEDAVLRVVAEAVANAHRHAAARRIDVEVRVTASELVARVRDDGIGMPRGATPGVGIASMRARAAELGGTLEIRSPGSGTEIVLALPREPRLTAAAAPQMPEHAEVPG